MDGSPRLGPLLPRKYRLLGKHADPFAATTGWMVVSLRLLGESLWQAAERWWEEAHLPSVEEAMSEFPWYASCVPARPLE